MFFVSSVKDLQWNFRYLLYLVPESTFCQMEWVTFNGHPYWGHFANTHSYPWRSLFSMKSSQHVLQKIWPHLRELILSFTKGKNQIWHKSAYFFAGGGQLVLSGTSPHSFFVFSVSSNHFSSSLSEFHSKCFRDVMASSSSIPRSSIIFSMSFCCFLIICSVVWTLKSLILDNVFSETWFSRIGSSSSSSSSQPSQSSTSDP